MIQSPFKSPIYEHTKLYHSLNSWNEPVVQNGGQLDVYKQEYK